MNSGNFAEGGDLLGGANTSFVRNVIAYRPIIDHDLDDVYSKEILLQIHLLGKKTFLIFLKKCVLLVL